MELPPKKTPKETVEVEKEFILKLAKQVGDIVSRLDNIEAMQETEKEVARLEPKTQIMTRIMGKPNINIEVNFVNHYTLQQIKDSGLQFQRELESMLERFEITSMVLNYKREIR